MERIDGERSEREIIYESLSNVTEYEMLQIYPDGIRLLAYVDTDEHEERIVRYGNADIVVRARKQIPALLYEGESLTDLIEYYDAEGYESFDTVSDEIPDQPETAIDNVDYLEWANGLVTKEELQQAALNLALSPNRDAAHETLTCATCGGNQKVAQECRCLYHDQQYGENDVWEPQAPDPACGTCGGSGAVEVQCERCDSIGVIAKHPFIQFFDEETGRTNRITLNLAHLIASGDVELTERISEYKSSTSDTEFVYRGIVFNLQNYIHQKVAELGYNPDATGIVTDDGLLGIPRGDKINIDATHATWRKENGKIKKQTSYGSKTAEGIIENAQQSLARQFAYRDDRMKNDSGLIGGEEWILRKLPLFEQSFELFKKRLFQTAVRGGFCTLGFTQFDAQRGAPEPAFYALDQDGNRLARISGDENIHASLETARAMFEALLIFDETLHADN